jgi:hypothetical protein
VERAGARQWVRAQAAAAVAPLVEVEVKVVAAMEPVVLEAEE